MTLAQQMYLAQIERAKTYKPGTNRDQVIADAQEMLERDNGNSTNTGNGCTNDKRSED